MTAAVTPFSRKQAESQRPTCDLPQPVLTAAMAMTGTSAAIIVLLTFLIAMNTFAVIMRKRFERRW